MPGEPSANLPAVSDDKDNPTKKTGFDDTAPKSAAMHAIFTMEQAQVHYNVDMADEQSVSAPKSAFQQAQEEQWYNLFLLEQHRLAEGQIYGERASEEAVAGPSLRVCYLCACTGPPRFRGFQIYTQLDIY